MHDQTFYPLTHAQTRMWFQELVTPKTNMRNAFTINTFPETVDFTRLGEAVTCFVKKTDVIRTRIVLQKGMLMQYSPPYRDFTPEVHDFTGNEEAYQSFIATHVARPLGNYDADLYYFSLITLPDGGQALFFGIHYVIGDDYTIALIIKAITGLYHDPEDYSPVHYGYFINKERTYHRSELYKRDEAFWLNELKNLNETTLPEPKSSRPVARQLVLSLSRNLEDAIKQFCDTHDLRFYVLFMSVFYLYISRIKNNADTIFGTITHGRDDEVLKKMPGMFADTLVMRINPGEGDLSFLSLLELVKKKMAAVLEHQAYGYDELIHRLEKDHPDLHSLFDMLFNYAREKNAQFARRCFTGTAEYPIIFNIHVTGKEKHFTIAIQYQTDMYTAADIETMVHNYITLLQNGITKPESTITSLNMLTPAMQKQLIDDFNPDRHQPEVLTTIPGVFEALAARIPDNDALCYQDQTLTYGKLNEKANRLAGTLRKNGVGPDVIVGIMTDRSLEMIIGIMGILKAGGAYLPIDPHYPGRRIAYMLEDSTPRLVLTQKHNREKITYPAPVLCLDDEAVYDGPGDNPPILNNPDDLAYIIYTSGSTGKPKGTLIRQASLIQTIKNMDFFTLTEQAGVIQLPNYVFDASILDIFGTLLNGGRLIMIPNDAYPDVKSISTIIKEQNVTHIVIPAALFNLLVDYDIQVLQNLKGILIGGERISTPHVIKAFKLVGPGVVSNGYGPTEATVMTSYYTVDRLPREHENIPIGKGMPAAGLFICNASNQLMPVGIPGELCIAGPLLARGYLGRPELTRSKFVSLSPPADTGSPHTIPWYVTANVDRIYKTGDLCRRLPDGNIDFLGRIDDQVKVRGHRIELGEIESILLEHDLVNKATAIVKKRAEDDALIIVYFQPVDDYKKHLPADAAPTTEHAKDMFDEIYGAPTPDTPDFTTIGWGSSYTGEDYTPGEMREWQSNAVAAITACNPRRVLELGCGTGLLLFELAPACDHYIGTDISHNAIRFIQEHKPDSLTNLDLRIGPADIVADIAYDTVDTIILNSVVQYFPSMEYLHTIIDRCIKTVKKGSLFIGDVRNYRLFNEFHTSIHICNTDDNETLSALNKKIQLSRLREKELLVDPDYFYALQHHYPQISSVSIRMRKDTAYTEMARFRYDVVLTIGESSKKPVIPEEVDYSTIQGSATTLADFIETRRPECITITNIPNKRVWDDILMEKALEQALQEGAGSGTVGDLRKSVLEGPGITPVNPGELYRVLDHLPYEISLEWHLDDLKYFHITLMNQESANDHMVDTRRTIVSDTPWSKYANNPGKVKDIHTIISRVKDFITDKVPEYMLPSNFVIVDTMPLTPNGKIDKKALEAFDTPVIFEDYEAPRNALEKTLAAIWQEVLGLDRVGINDNFFHLGGHSLKAISVVLQIKKKLHITLEIAQLFKTPRIKSLSSVLQKHEHTGFDHIPVAGTRDFYPASAQQQSLYALQQIADDYIAYNVPQVYLLSGELDAAQLENAFSLLITKHEALRTGFTLIDETPVQKIADRVDFTLTYEEHAREAIPGCYAEFIKPFDLGAPPLIRALLIKIAPDEHVLCIDIHHIIADGLSMAIIVHDLSAVYNGKDIGDVPLTYMDYAVWQQEGDGRREIDSREQFWLDMYAGEIPLPDMPTDYPRPSTQSFEGGRITRTLDQQTGEKIKALCRHLDVTEFMLLLAVYNVVLAAYSGKDDIVVGTPVAGRNHADLEPLVGMFVNTLAIRSHIDHQKPFAEYLNTLKTTTLRAFEHQTYPFEALIEKLPIKRDLSRNPLFDTMFVMQKLDIEPFTFGDIHIEPWDINHRSTKFDLTFTIYDAETLQFSLEYCTAIYKEQTIERFFEYFTRVLHGVLSDANRKIETIEVIPEDEKQKLLDTLQTHRKTSQPDTPRDTKTPHHTSHTHREKMLLSLWKEVLGVTDIGITDNFFHRGGHSLKAIKLLTKVKQRFHVDVSLGQFFKAPHIKAFNELLHDLEKDEFRTIPPVPPRPYYPTSSQQKRLYALQQFDPESIAYNVPLWLKLTGDLNIPRLESAFQAVITKHEALRTVFSLVDDEPVQRIMPDCGLSITYTEISTGEPSPEILRQYLTDFMRPFDLNIPPLLRVTVMKVKSEHHLLFIDMHHIITDGLSMVIFIRDLSTAYNGESPGVLDIHYKEYAVWRQEDAGKQKRDYHQQFWLDMYRDEIPVVDLPTDYPRPAVQSFEGEHITRTLDATMGEKIKALCRRLEVTEYMVLFAVYNVVLAKYAGSSDIIVGTPAGGREHADLDDIMGMFVNTLAIRSSIDPNLRFTDYLGI